MDWAFDRAKALPRLALPASRLPASRFPATFPSRHQRKKGPCG